MLRSRSLPLDCRPDPFRLLARRAIISLLLIALSNSPSGSADPADGQGVARVGVVQAPPFAMRTATVIGRALQLSSGVMSRAIWDCCSNFRMPTPDLLAAIQRRELVAVVTAVASAERERVMDLSHPYYSSGLAIAVRAGPGGVDWPWLLDNLFSGEVSRDRKRGWVSSSASNVALRLNHNFEKGAPNVLTRSIKTI